MHIDDVYDNMSVCHGLCHIVRVVKSVKSLWLQLAITLVKKTRIFHHHGFMGLLLSLYHGFNKSIRGCISFVTQLQPNN